MIRNIVVGLVLVASLSACSGKRSAAEAQNADVKVTAVNIKGKAYDCLPKRAVQIISARTELVGVLRTRFLTPEAQLAKVRVWVASTDVTNYGTTKITYTDENDSCVLWSEGLTLQEYHQRLGQTPLGISPFYMPDVPAPAPVKSSESEITPAL